MAGIGQGLFEYFPRLRTIADYAIDPNYNPKRIQLNNLQLSKLQAALNSCNARQEEQLKLFHKKAQEWGRIVIANGKYENGRDSNAVEPNTVSVGVVQDEQSFVATIRPGDNTELDILAASILNFAMAVEARVQEAFK
ncbi:MAG TPA: hypothetical protein VK843_09200 [Planctomycetota bacterium]|nr:hypothetical protein [Planctomycetota bacterium]